MPVAYFFAQSFPLNPETSIVVRLDSRPFLRGADWNVLSSMRHMDGDKPEWRLEIWACFGMPK